MSILADQYRRWFQFEKDSHRQVLASFDTIPAGRRDHPDRQRALDWMAHIIAGRLIWLSRFSPLPPPANIFPKGVAQEDLPGQLLAMEAAWDDYFSLPESDLNRDIEYLSVLDQKHYRIALFDILTQLFGHSLYHRGQIAMLVRGLGGTPAATDFGFWARGNDRFL